MLNNPCKYFVNGSDEKVFTHEGGPTLYHFSPRASGLSKFMEMNVVFFANDKEHAKRVVVNMLRFKLKCLKKKYEAYRLLGRPVQGKTAAAKVEHLLENQHLWKITKAPTNQFYLVSWAGNDIA